MIIHGPQRRQRAHLPPSGRCFCVAAQSVLVPAPGPEPESAGRTVIAAPCQGAAHRFRGPRRWWPGLAPAGRRVVLLCHAGRDAPARTDRQAMLLCPGPDITAALTARRGPPAPARLCPPGLAGVLKIGRQLLAERG